MAVREVKEQTLKDAFRLLLVCRDYRCVVAPNTRASCSSPSPTSCRVRVLLDLLPNRQSAYRPHDSTETAIIAMHDEIVKTVDSGDVDVYTVVLLDLSVAFDSVDHQILLQILNKRLAVENVALAWCQSYLCQRLPTCCANGQSAGPYNMDYSVPQGSVLSPLKCSHGQKAPIFWTMV